MLPPYRLPLSNLSRPGVPRPHLLAELRSTLQTEFRTGLHSLRADLLRWMFGFWASTLLMLAGLVIALHGS